MKLLLSLSLLYVLAEASPSVAQDKIQDCTKLWQLEKEAGCPAAPPSYALPVAPAQTPTKETFTKTKSFKSSKCIPGDEVDTLVESLEDKCDKWTDKMKADLAKKGRRISGVCNNDCSPCPKNESLQKCSVNGEVRVEDESN